jgi:hypothetical protein
MRLPPRQPNDCIEASEYGVRLNTGAVAASDQIRRRPRQIGRFGESGGSGTAGSSILSNGNLNRPDVIEHTLVTNTVDQGSAMYPGPAGMSRFPYWSRLPMRIALLDSA